MKLLSLLFLCFIGTAGFGQYYYLANPGPFSGSLNGDPAYPAGGGQAAGWTSLLGPSVTAPTWSANQALPFAFNFNGSAVTDYKVSSNGVLTFDVASAVTPGNTPAALPSANIPNNSVCLWGLVASGTNDNVSIKVFGSAPNRQLWVHYSSCVNGSIGWSYQSIVLVEGSDLIHLVDQRNTTGTGALSAGIQIDGSTAFSVAGSPALGGIAGTDFTDADDYHYTFYQGMQAADDIALTEFDLLPYVGAGNNNITGTIVNLGTNTVTSLDVVWNDGTGPQSATLTGLSVASNTTYDFTHSTPLMATIGTSYSIDLTASVANETDLTNNMLTKPTVTLSSIPVKYVVGEEKTGTWCGWCPRGAVGLAGMESEPLFIGIAVHNGDPMTIASYDGNIGTYIPGGYPGGGVDRVIDNDPSLFALMFNDRSSAVVPCSVNDVTATINGTTGEIEVSTAVEFYGDIAGDYRISAVVLEDNVVGTGSGSYAQVNYYNNNGPLVDPVSGFDWATAGDPVNANDFGGYDHVARFLSSNDILGDAGSLPAGTVPAGTHNYSFANVPSGTVDMYSNTHVAVMVINAATGEILNAGKTEITIPVEVALVDFDLPAVLPFGNSDIIGTVENLGTTPITSLDVSWNAGSGANNFTFTGLNIAVGGTYTFTHPTQLAADPGAVYSIVLTASTAGDADAGNNSITKIANVPSDLGLFDGQNSSFEYSIYPNPSNGLFAISINSEIDSEITYYVTDATGRLAINSVTRTIAENQVIKLDGSDLTSGLYFVTVITGNKATTKPIQIVK